MTGCLEGGVEERVSRCAYTKRCGMMQAQQNNYKNALIKPFFHHRRFKCDSQTYSGLSCHLVHCMLTGRMGQGMVGFLRRSPFPWCLEVGGSEHTKTFGIGDGFQQSLSQLLLAAVLRQQ